MKKPFLITVCASGGGGNFDAIIKKQLDLGYVITLLIVDRDCGAIQKAINNNIPYLLLNKRELKDDFPLKFDQAISPTTDLIVLAGFFPIIDSQFCKKWRNKIINTHPSLLPKYGGKGMVGVKVQEAVLADKCQLAGCTVHYVNENIDEGKIILQKSIPVKSNESAWELGGRVFQEENKLLVEAIKLIIDKSEAANV